MKARLLLLFSLAACGGATDPQGLDPTVLIQNFAPTFDPRTGVVDTLYFTWRDGQGITGSVAVPPGQQVCTRFTARADSAYFEAHIAFNHSTITAPWFDPTTRSAWTMLVTPDIGGILLTDVSPNLPC